MRIASAVLLVTFSAPVMSANFITTSESPIVGQYLVVLKQAQPSASARHARLDTLAKTNKVRLARTYENALNGGVMLMSAAQAKAMARNAQVAYVEQDRYVRLNPSVSSASSLTVQSAVPSWGLDRIDQRNLPLSGTYNYGYSGLGVTAYVIDTGIRYNHQDFAGNVRFGFDAFNDGLQGSDCNGHGTHVAGTLGGLKHGVAKNVTLVSVRVLDCAGSGTLSGVIAGIDWVTSNAKGPAVANMSLGGGASTALDNAVSASIARGISYVVAAGNEKTDACMRSPARVAAALTVAASTSTDEQASYSNFGKCVNLYAPGSAIRSAWASGDSATATLSGTSMAAPHVAGVAALYLQANPGASPANVSKAISSAATLRVIKKASGGTPNRLLYSAPN
jgi:subtilisin family serine protease